MNDREKVIKRLEECLSASCRGFRTCPYSDDAWDAVASALTLLQAQEPVEPHYTTLRYLVNGTEVIVHHPECPRCIRNGLALWDAEIEQGQAYCKRCGQAVKWNSKENEDGSPRLWEE